MQRTKETKGEIRKDEKKVEEERNSGGAGKVKKNWGENICKNK